MAVRKASAYEIKRGLRSAKGAPKSSAHLKGRKGSAAASTPVAMMSVVGVAGL